MYMGIKLVCAFNTSLLTCPAAVTGSLCLSWLAGVAGSERPLGWAVADSVHRVTGHDVTLPLGALETLASARGCGGRG